MFPKTVLCKYVHNIHPTVTKHVNVHVWHLRSTVLLISDLKRKIKFAHIGQKKEAIWERMSASKRVITLSDKGEGEIGASPLPPAFAI